MKIENNKKKIRETFSIFPCRVKIQRIFQAINFPNRLLSGNTDKKHKSSSLFFLFSQLQFSNLNSFFLLLLFAGCCCLEMVLNRENVIPKEMRIVIRFLV